MSFRFIKNSISGTFCSKNKFYGSKSIPESLITEKIEVNDGKDITYLSKTWSQKQMPKSLALRGARFETVNLVKQPNPAAAIDLIAKVPIIEVHENIVACAGGGEKLGHPKIFINLVYIFFVLLVVSLLLGPKTSNFMYIFWLTLTI